MCRDRAVLRAEQEVDPRFIRGQRAVERPDGQVVEPSREPGHGVAAGLRLAIDFDGSHNRDTVPRQHLDATLEPGLPGVVRNGRPFLTGCGPRHDESWAAPLEALFDEKWQIRGAIPVRFGQEVERVQVARRAENRQHAAVEVDRALEVRIPLGELEPEELELLDGIDRMDGALHRQMDVVHLHQQQRLVDDAQTLFPGEDRPSFRRAEEAAKVLLRLAGLASGNLQQLQPLAELDFSHGPPLPGGGCHDPRTRK
jgi:hypothetical protein